MNRKLQPDGNVLRIHIVHVMKGSHASTAVYTVTVDTNMGAHTFTSPDVAHVIFEFRVYSLHYVIVVKLRDCRQIQSLLVRPARYVSWLIQVGQKVSLLLDFTMMVLLMRLDCRKYLSFTKGIL